MDKLIELLNEYKKIKGYDGDTKIINYNTNTLSFSNGYSLLDYEIVISKRYGFIKRLVDNDKIDFQKVMEQNKNGYDITRVNPDDNFIDNAIEYDDELDLFIIMLLAIQDEPIEFLISILK